MNRPPTVTNEQAHRIAARLDFVESLMFRLGIATGLRISDLVRLSMRTIRQNPLNVYESKSRRTRTIKISEELHAEILRRYSTDSDAYAFYSLRDVSKPYDRTTYHRKLKRALTGLQMNVSAHSTRKLYAQNIFAETNDLETVQKSLNHLKATTTKTYLDIE